MAQYLDLKNDFTHDPVEYMEKVAYTKAQRSV